MFRYGFSLLVMLPSSTYLITAKTVPLEPLFDCTDPKEPLAAKACKAGDYTQCCPMVSQCCAGGCCGLGGICVVAGTGKEICCAIDDPHTCGLGLSSVKLTGLCSANDNLNWYACPEGSECGTSKETDTCETISGAAKLFPAETSKVVKADASTIHGASRTTAVPVSSIMDTPKESATNAGRSASAAPAAPAAGSTSPSDSPTKPNAASNFVAGFSLTILVAILVWLLR